MPDFNAREHRTVGADKNRLAQFGVSVEHGVRREGAKRANLGVMPHRGKGVEKGAAHHPGPGPHEGKRRDEGAFFNVRALCHIGPRVDQAGEARAEGFQLANHLDSRGRIAQGGDHHLVGFGDVSGDGPQQWGIQRAEAFGG